MPSRIIADSTKTLQNSTHSLSSPISTSLPPFTTTILFAYNTTFSSPCGFSARKPTCDRPLQAALMTLPPRGNIARRELIENLLYVELREMASPSCHKKPTNSATSSHSLDFMHFGQVYSNASIATQHLITKPRPRLRHQEPNLRVERPLCMGCPGLQACYINTITRLSLDSTGADLETISVGHECEYVSLNQSPCSTTPCLSTPPTAQKRGALDGRGGGCIEKGERRGGWGSLIGGTGKGLEDLRVEIEYSALDTEGLVGD
ncbi:uncharacterized protein BDR25DRAFT_351464 [Lindgomyces ingoldianus]|uniref:Uncharacterized protein n=1 Tax=Lindgomyces ingoldianus TaxID=673940 RepID=A0ACB6R6T9_9PLEO|nr:uncharacterized protein BDR25DRAFT_351464 [Lindgomyces ingoldianus]KAF2474974.1 hypothetical protein BDR25DRAFT_351464 [Lindgomyces ingoldianus]